MFPFRWKIRQVCFVNWNRNEKNAMKRRVCVRKKKSEWEKGKDAKNMSQINWIEIDTNFLLFFIIIFIFVIFSSLKWCINICYVTIKINNKDREIYIFYIYCVQFTIKLIKKQDSLGGEKSFFLLALFLLLIQMKTDNDQPWFKFTCDIVVDVIRCHDDIKRLLSNIASKNKCVRKSIICTFTIEKKTRQCNINWRKNISQSS